MRNEAWRALNQVHASLASSKSLVAIPDQERLRQEAGRVRSSGVLGEARLARLFDYLLENSIAGVAPKEVTIARDVFDKTASFDVSQDALVRVYVHKIRRTLELFYKTPGGDGVYIHLPRGEYRLVLAASPSTSAPELASSSLTPPSTALASRSGWRVTPGACALGLAAAAMVGAFAASFWQRMRSSEPPGLAEVRHTAVWQRILNDARPLLIVVGDYYLVGESDASMEVRRLIREYEVNSRNDLEQFLKLHPDAADRYVDVGLHYFPTSAAFALKDVVPLLTDGQRSVEIAKMSDVNADTLKSHDIVYIGYLSGLGILQQLVFSGSRFAIGNSFDELTDLKSQQGYVSQTASQSGGAMHATGRVSAYHDYGYFASFLGPVGNPIIVIAGTRDEGVMQTAEAATTLAKLRELQQGGIGASLEALYDVRALDGVNLTGRLLVQSGR